MKNLKYIIILFLGGAINAYSQADLTVEEEATIFKTVTIGGINDTNGEVTLNDTGNDGKVEIDIITSIGNAHIETEGSDFRLGSIDKDVTFRSGNTNFSRILTTGEWGIGTSFPDAIMHVSQGGNSGINNPILLLESIVSQRPMLRFSEGGVGTNSGMTWYMNGTPSQNRLHILDTSDDELITFSNLIRFGIGVIGDPRETLEVNGNIKIQTGDDFSFMDGSVVKSRLECSGANVILENLQTNGDVELISAQNDVRIESLANNVFIDSGDDLVFRINGDNKVFLRASGRLGINNTVPEAMIHIKQNSSEDGLRIQDNQNADDWSFDIGVADLFIKFNNVDAGHFDDADGSYTALSDRRLKKSILPLEDGIMDKLMLLEVSRYNYIDDSTQQETIGFMAQDVMKYFPEVVTTWKNKNGEDYYGISYDLLNVIVVKAIQEQQQQKEKLLNQWQELQTLNDELEEVKTLVSSLSKELNSYESNQ